jgi:hypothetical protein
VSTSALPLEDGALQTYIRYFRALEHFDVPTVLACFSPEVEYHHHPFSQVHEGFEDDTEWHVVRGHDELRKLLEFRGPDPIAHHISAFARTGNICCAEGFTPGEPGQPPIVTWISLWTADDEDRIVKYTAYIQWPAVPLIGADDLSCV